MSRRAEAIAASSAHVLEFVSPNPPSPGVLKGKFPLLHCKHQLQTHYLCHHGLAWSHLYIRVIWLSVHLWAKTGSRKFKRTEPNRTSKHCLDPILPSRSCCRHRRDSQIQTELHWLQNPTQSNNSIFLSVASRMNRSNRL